MAASGEAPGGFAGWVAWWRAADGGGVLMGAVGQPLIARSQNSEVFVMRLPRTLGSGFIVMAAEVLGTNYTPCADAVGPVTSDASKDESRCASRQPRPQYTKSYLP